MPGTWGTGGATCSSHLLIDHAGAANVIVQGAFLVVEARDDETDGTNQPAEPLRKIASQRAQVRNLAAFRRHDLDLARHFAEGRAEFADHEGFITECDPDLDAH